MQNIAEAFAAARLLPVIVIDDARAAAPLSDALREGGLDCAEITLRTPAAIEALAAMAQNQNMLVGAGTVLTTGQAEQAVRAGARYVVTPGFSPAIVQYCQDRSVPVFPGVATATEIQMAADAGLETVKFFPAEPLGGAGMLRALAAPFTGMKFIPTGGISADTLPEYLSQPAVTAVGGSWMAPRALISAGNFAQISKLTAEAVSLATGAATMRSR